MENQRLPVMWSLAGGRGGRVEKASILRRRRSPTRDELASLDPATLPGAEHRAVRPDPLAPSVAGPSERDGPCGGG